MKEKLPLQEKLKLLRNEKELKLDDVAKETGIPTSTLQRIENDYYLRAAYQDIKELAIFYDVSTDYLIGLTENRQYRNTQSDELKLTDETIAVLKDDNFNNRLLSELISHEDFPALLNSIEVYVDRKMSAQMGNLNAYYKFAEEAIKSKHEISKRDEFITILEDAQLDEDEYLRFRISERFNIILKGIYDTHRIDIPPEDENYILDKVKDGVNSYFDLKDKEFADERAEKDLILKHMGIDPADFSDEEIKLLLKLYDKSKTLNLANMSGNRNQRRKLEKNKKY